MRHFITHVRKDNQNNIIAVKTTNLALHTHEVVSMIKNQNYLFFSWDGIKQAQVGVYDNKWIRSHADGVWTNNLDNLPRF